MTVLTDLALGICNAWWGVALFRRGCSQRQYSQALWGIGFIAAALAAVLGGAAHAVGDQSPTLRRRLWKGTTLSTGFTSASMLASAALACTTQPLQGKLISWASWQSCWPTADGWRPTTSFSTSSSIMARPWRVSSLSTVRPRCVGAPPTHATFWAVSRCPSSPRSYKCARYNFTAISTIMTCIIWYRLALAIFSFEVGSSCETGRSPQRTTLEFRPMASPRVSRPAF